MRRIMLVALAGLLVCGWLGLAQELGSRDRPIIWVFPPSTSPGVIQQIATKIAEDIGRMTGLYIVPRVMPDYAALIEAFKAAEGDVMGVPTTDQYARISVETNFEATPRLAAVRYGYPYYFASIYAPRDKGFESVEDLEGKVWIYNDEGSTSGYVLPKMLLDRKGITLAGVVKSGGHTNSMIALLEGQGDFCTGYGSPPVPPDWVGELMPDWKWEYGMYPELWVWDPVAGTLPTDYYKGLCVDLRRAAAQTGLYGTLDEIVTEIGIVDTVGPVPNDCIAFSPGFPKDVQDELVDAMITHIRSPEGQELWGDPEFYEWTDVAEIDDTYYCNYRELIGLPNPPTCPEE
ncbi:MAG: PhnD/SsuA/transferrin family substrate-binding protein [Candidatus Bipolaricaulaceae bacterium]